MVSFLFVYKAELNKNLKTISQNRMASQPDHDDDDTPHLGMSEKWKKAFEEIFVVFSPDKWKLAPTDTGMPGGWREFKDSAKVKFLCTCGNSWTSMAGRIIFWFKKIEESERKEEPKTNDAKGGIVKEEGEGSGSASIKDTKKISVCMYILLKHLICNTSVRIVRLFCVAFWLKESLQEHQRVESTYLSSKDMLTCLLAI